MTLTSEQILDARGMLRMVSSRSEPTRWAILILAALAFG
jgi:hypothetical protein